MIDRVFAAFIFFTRLPFWRLRQPAADAFKRVVELWPLTGWLTGGVAALTLWGTATVLPYSLAVIVAIGMRMILTGALHEDGLADFFDGFGGGGRDRGRILAIMKDSHIGTYGVLALVMYLLLLFFALRTLPCSIAALALFAADPFAKMLTAQLVALMPYARNEKEAKARVVYKRITWKAELSIAVQGLLPMLLFLLPTDICWLPVVAVPSVVAVGLIWLVWNRLKGYTGDCCGAVFLLVELAVYVTLCGVCEPRWALWSLWG